MARSISRRRFLKYVAAGAAGAGVAASLPWRVRAQPAAERAWGHIRPPIWTTPPECKVLEIHLYGGMSPWETFYCRGPASTARYRGFEREMAALPFVGGSTSCDPGATDARLFGRDALNHDVYFSRLTQPLWTDAILSKTRVVVLKHTLEPHEAAIPYALTGFTLGQPNLAGLGAVLQHRYLAIDDIAGTSHDLPYAYVCQPSDFIATDNLQASVATGTHRGDARPVVLPLSDNVPGFLQTLARTGVTSRHDELLAQYRAHYRDLLRSPRLGPSNLVRSKGFSSYDASAHALSGSPRLRTLLSDSTSPWLTQLRRDAECPRYEPGDLANMPGTGVRLAAFLLARSAARYAGVIDIGLVGASGGGAYDTHNTEHIHTTAINLWNVLATLRELVDNHTLDLSTTLVVLTTEFGRTRQRNGDGRDHWPWGYVNVLIGGPVRRGISGAIQDAEMGDSDDGYAHPEHFYNPADVRAAVLLAAGVYPFEPENFGVRDISFATPADGHEALMRRLKTDVLGAEAGA